MHANTLLSDTDTAARINSNYQPTQPHHSPA